MLVCEEERVGYHRIPEVTIKEFLRMRPRCKFCGEPLRLKLERLTDEERNLVLMKGEDKSD